MPRLAKDEFGHPKVRSILGGRASVVCYERDPLLWNYRHRLKEKRTYVYRQLNEPDLAIAVRKAEDLYLKIVDEQKPTNKSIKEAIREWIQIKHDKFDSKQITINTVKGVKTAFVALEMYLCKVKKLQKMSEIKEDTFMGYVLWRTTKSWKLIERSGTPSPPKTSTVKRDLVILKDWYRNYLIPKEYALKIPSLEQISIHQDQMDANPPIPLETDWVKIYKYFESWSKEHTVNPNRERSQFYREMVRHFVLICYNCGARPKELLGILVRARVPHPEGGWVVQETIRSGLRWRDVEVEPQTHTASSGKTFEFLEAMLYIHETKTGQPREIPTNTGSYFVRWRKFCDQFRKENGMRKLTPEDYVFFNPFTEKPYPYSMVYNAWRDMRTNLSLVLTPTKSGKPYTLYSLRTSYITNQINEGKDVYLIKKITGHSLEVLNRHYDRSDLRKRRGEATARTYGKTARKSKAIDLQKLDKYEPTTDDWDIEKDAKEYGYKTELVYKSTPKTGKKYEAYKNIQKESSQSKSK